MWLLPTLDRIKKLENLFEHTKEFGCDTPCLILVDGEDWDKNKERYQDLSQPAGWTFHITKAVTMAEKVREVFPTLKDRKWVGLLNDDHEPGCKDWDKKLVDRLNGTNFVSANDRSQRTFLTPVTATAWSMPLLEAIGWPIYPPLMQHLFIDDIWRDLGKATGIWRICADAIVYHRHVLFGEGENDETHKKVYGEEFPVKPGKLWDNDQAVYQNIIKHDFQDVVAKIRKLQNHIPAQRYSPYYRSESEAQKESAQEPK